VSSYYELLGVVPTAPSDEVKRAFRREIAKYHPDKVQHLGREFQEIAAVKAAALTQAYKTLSDDAQRADYDAQLARGAAAPPGFGRTAPAAPPPAASSRAVPSTPPEDRDRGVDRGSRSSPDRDGASDLVRRAAVARFRQAIDAEFGQCEDAPVPGFDIVCAPPKGTFWSKIPPRVLARVVPTVDAAAVSESWAMVSRLRRDEREVCVFVMGPVVAPAGELARAIAEERRKPLPAGHKLTLVPVNTRSWSAHIPNDAPPVVKALVTRLKSA